MHESSNHILVDVVEFQKSQFLKNNFCMISWFNITNNSDTFFFAIRLDFLSLKHMWLPKHDYSKYNMDIWMNDTVLLESHDSITFEPSKWLQYPLIFSRKHNWYGVSNSVFRLWTHPKILNKRLCQSIDLQYRYWYLGLAFFWMIWPYNGSFWH